MIESLQIASHCYCPPGVEHYAQQLRFQVASLLRYAPDTLQVRYTVFYAPQDDATHNGLNALRDAYARHLEQHEEIPRPPRVLVEAWPLAPEYLFRRAIGRNLVATQTTCDAVWFTDVDYLFGPGCLAALQQQMSPDIPLACPQQIWIHRDHATGDADLAAQLAVDLPEIHPEHYLPRRQRIVIGGCQIVGGEIARRIGYCRGSKWIEPVDPRQGFRSCKCDRAFRKLNALHARYLDLPGVYRMRHSIDGRDFDLHGAKRGREVW